MSTEWKQYLLRQLALHPVMRPQDVYKLMYQAAFGAEHLLADKDAAYAFFKKEYDEILPEDEPLYEQIQENLFRVNLRAWKRKKLPSEWLFRLFVGGMEAPTEGQKFLQYKKVAEEVLQQGGFPFSVSDFQKYTEEYEQRCPGPVHHSEVYRESERPAYRLVKGEYLRLLPVLERMAEENARKLQTTSDRSSVVIALEGRCASGKTTMARMLSEVTGAGVVHMDDFFLPGELRTEERLREAGGNVHYERFLETVIPRLKKTQTFSYVRFDCSRMELGEERAVCGSDFRIVEGAYSAHPVFGKYYDFMVFSDIKQEEQEKRILHREGEGALEMFRQRWIPMEEWYFQTFSARENADIVV